MAVVGDDVQVRVALNGTEAIGVQRVQVNPAIVRRQHGPTGTGLMFKVLKPTLPPFPLLGISSVLLPM